MYMQRSSASTLDGDLTLRLSGPLSEWLFASNFWPTFNAQHGTTFDQFEECDVTNATIKALVNALDNRILELQNEGENLGFVYRWTSEKKPITASISKDKLLSELEDLREFLIAAERRNADLTLSL